MNYCQYLLLFSIPLLFPVLLCHWEMTVDACVLICMGTLSSGPSVWHTTCGTTKLQVLNKFITCKFLTSHFIPMDPFLIYVKLVDDLNEEIKYASINGA